MSFFYPETHPQALERTVGIAVDGTSSARGHCVKQQIYNDI